VKASMRALASGQSRGGLAVPEGRGAAGGGLRQV